MVSPLRLLRRRRRRGVVTPSPRGGSAASLVAFSSVVLGSDGGAWRPDTSRAIGQCAGISAPVPVVKYCCTIAMMLEITQYSTRPAWNDQAKMTTISGMNCITRFTVACCPSAEREAIIRACTNWNAPASSASSEI